MLATGCRMKSWHALQVLLTGYIPAGCQSAQNAAQNACGLVTTELVAFQGLPLNQIPAAPTSKWRRLLGMLDAAHGTGSCTARTVAWHVVVTGTAAAACGLCPDVSSGFTGIVRHLLITSVVSRVMALRHCSFSLLPFSLYCLGLTTVPFQFSWQAHTCVGQTHQSVCFLST